VHVESYLQEIILLPHSRIILPARQQFRKCRKNFLADQAPQWYCFCKQLHKISRLQQTEQVMDVSEIRYLNFRYLFEQFKTTARDHDPGAPDKGMMKAFGERLGIKQAYMSHINTRYKGIGALTARQMEKALKLPHGWMDQQHDEPCDERRDEPRRSVAAAASGPASAQASASAPSVIVTESVISDANELAFVEAAVQAYRLDPVAAQAALMRLLTAKLRG
jgi:hypothetical protein